MAINVDTVYKTVLMILNKEQRGVMTPQEFSKIASRVQSDIFETYFTDYNTLLNKAPQTPEDYYNKTDAISDKLAPFRVYGECIYKPATSTFIMPEITNNGITVIDSANTIFLTSDQRHFYRLGELTYEAGDFPIDVQLVTRTELNNIQRSEMTRATEQSPLFLLEHSAETDKQTSITVVPSTIQDNLYASFIVKPRDVTWNFITGDRGEYLFDGTSTHFELHSSEQTNVINRILFYAGVVVRDPSIIQSANQEMQRDEINKKS